MKELLFATRNKNKAREIQEIFGEGFKVLSLDDAGIDTEIIEDGKTFEENSMKKAEEIMKVSGKVVLADDSGLEIDYLNKAPGVYSARYLGEDTSYDIKNAKILEKLEGIEDKDRTARFVCVVSAAFPDGRKYSVRGTIEGIIAHEIKGENGFGYDPIFYVPEYSMTTAEMSPQIKNEISHRGKAIRAMKEKLSEAGEL
ncbi:MAG: XTP/dITP diphosphatase [Firmicutes bacterium]|nr:XTP/dITP diphosphatase [Bacillota bacterium]